MEELFQIAKSKYSIDLQKFIHQLNNLQFTNMNEIINTFQTIRDAIKQDVSQFFNSNNQILNNIINFQEESRAITDRHYTQLDEHIEEKTTRSEINEMMMLLGGRIIEILTQFEQREEQLFS
jgi:hypothetical protein